MSQYPGGVTKSELEIRLRKLQAEVNRLLATKATSTARNVAVQIAAEALESVYWDGVLGKPTTFPPDPHTHAESDITDLDKYTQAQVDALLAALDYYTTAEVDALLASVFDLEDLDGGIASSFYVGLLADGGDASEVAFTDGIVDPGGA